MNYSVKYFTFEITPKYVNNKKQNEINYENGYWISYPKNGSTRRFSLKKIKNDVNNYIWGTIPPDNYIPFLHLTNNKINNKPLGNITSSTLFKRRNSK